MDDTTAKILSAIILFVMTTLVSTVPVHLLDYFSRHSAKHYHTRNGVVVVSAAGNTTTAAADTTGTHLKRHEYEDHSEHGIIHKLVLKLKRERIIQFLTQIGGGVLLYTAFVHMLPEIRESYESYLEGCKKQLPVNDTMEGRHGNITTDDDGDGEHGLPLVDLCACAGFFGIFLIEELTHTFLLKNHDHHGTDTRSTSLSSSPSSSAGRNNKQAKRPIGSVGIKPKPLSSRYISSSNHHYREHIDSESDISAIDSTAGNSGNTSTESIIVHRTMPYHSSATTVMTVSNGMLTERDPITMCKSPPPCYESCDATELADQPHTILNKCDVENISNFELFINEESSTLARIFDALLMILAFSCHSIFDGISIGVQSNNQIWTVLIAILSHKLLIAFVLSMQVFERCRKGKNAHLILWVFGTVFAVMSPIGVLIVIIMDKTSSAPDSNQLHIVILAAISAGTIIYIVFLEIIDKSSSRTHISGFVQWIALLIGFGLMHLVSTLFHED